MGQNYPQSSFQSSPVQATTYSGDLRFGMVGYDRGLGVDSASLVWCESVNGNGTLWSVADSADAPRPLSGEHSVRGELGYGGGEFTVSHGYVYFVSGGRLYRVGVGDSVCRDSRNRIPRPLTPVAFGSWASPVVSPDGRWLVAIHEDEYERTRLVVLDTAGRLWPKILVDGFDFLMTPRFDPVTHSLVWVAWREGEMPWDAATLWRAPWLEPETPQELPRIGPATKIAGGEEDHRSVAVLQPEFLPNGQLVYLSDESGYGRFVTEPQRLPKTTFETASGTAASGTTESETTAFGTALEKRALETESISVESTESYELIQPAWIQETRVYAVLPDATIAVIVDRGGVQSVEHYDPATKILRPLPGIPSLYQEYQSLAASADGRIAMIASGPQTPPRLIEWNRGTVRVVRRSSAESVAPADLALCTPTSWTIETSETSENRENNKNNEINKNNETNEDKKDSLNGENREPESTVGAKVATTGTVPTKERTLVHGMVWEPVRGSWRTTRKTTTSQPSTNDERPPLLVMVHGGPTSHVRAGWNTTAQYFATRGWLVLSVNHRGSTGFGRRYRDQLRGQWGEIDCEDIVSGVREFSLSGRCDPKRVVLLGGSAGGFTALTVLQRYPDWFTAGVISYPVADLCPPSLDATGRPVEPKFERHYFEWLIGPYPECSQRYQERSPLRNGREIRVPIAIFHGRNDRIVPVSQSESLVAQMVRNGTPHIFRIYDGESHGFRRTETLQDYYRTIEEFFHTLHIL